MAAAKKRKSVVNQIRQHSRQLVRELDVIKGVYQNSGYTFTQCHVLFELSRNKTLTLMELVEILLIDKSNTSRTIKGLVEKGLVKARKNSEDNRQKYFSLTANGEKVLRSTIRLADQQVNGALDNLSNEQQQLVVMGMQLYAAALRKNRLQEGYTIRQIQRKDNAQIACIIREVMTEFAAIGEGYSIGDADVDDMWSSYRDQGACYFVITDQDTVVGGGGIGPLKGGDKQTCELRKMFFQPEIRGLGLGRRLLLTLLDEARGRQYKRCYLETLKRMDRAVELYKKNGFQKLDNPLGKTGHCSCDCWYALNL